MSKLKVEERPAALRSRPQRLVSLALKLRGLEKWVETDAFTNLLEK
jgi:hypothetical protein